MQRNDHGVVWNKEASDKLLELVTDERNIGYVEIAKQMTAIFNVTFTKNSCIGKARRLRLPSRPPKPLRPRLHVMKKKVDAPIPVIEPLRKKGHYLTIHQLREGDCKWPMGRTEHRPPYFYCGQPALLGCSWCKVHFKKAHDKATYGNATKSRQPW